MKGYRPTRLMPGNVLTYLESCLKFHVVYIHLEKSYNDLEKTYIHLDELLISTRPLENFPPFFMIL